MKNKIMLLVSFLIFLVLCGGGPRKMFATGEVGAISSAHIELVALITRIDK